MNFLRKSRRLESSAGPVVGFANMLDDLTKPERMLLLKFVCAFAWTDLEVQKQEREFIRRLMGTLKLESDEAEQVDQWLRLPPSPEELDPEKVPRNHRALFLECARRVIESDGHVDPNEAELYDTLEQLLFV